MAQRKINTVREQIFWSYASLAMARAAVTKGRDKFDYSIREFQYKKFMQNDHEIRDFFEDEKEKQRTGSNCNFCGSPDFSTIDHIFPKILKGPGTADNLLPSCKKCNSSKGMRDFMEWNEARIKSGEKYLPLMIIQRYLKLVYFYCKTYDYLDKDLVEFIEFQYVSENKIPFKIDLLPIKFPDPIELKLHVEPKNLNSL